MYIPLTPVTIETLCLDCFLSKWTDAVCEQEVGDRDRDYKLTS